MPPLEISHVISLCSLLIAAFALYRNIRGDTRTDAGQLTTLIVKLEGIAGDTKEIKSDMKDVKSDMDRMKEKLTLNEASVKSAHKRIDYLQEVICYEKKNTQEDAHA